MGSAMAHTAELEPRTVSEPISPDLDSGEKEREASPSQGKPAGGFFRKPRVRLLLILAVLFLIIAAASIWGYYWSRESTDNAQIDGHIHPISARVGGYVILVNVDDN